jgi:hypothetical protein
MHSLLTVAAPFGVSLGEFVATIVLAPAVLFAAPATPTAPASPRTFASASSRPIRLGRYYWVQYLEGINGRGFQSSSDTHLLILIQV